MPITIQADALVGMLTDVLRTASKDPAMPYFHQVRLYQTDRKDAAVLVAESTDRYLAGQAWDAVEGQLPAVTVDVRTVKSLITVLKEVHGLLTVRLGVDGDTLTAAAAGMSGEYATTRTPFPNLDRMQPAHNEPIDTILMSESILSPLIAISKQTRADAVRIQRPAEERAGAHRRKLSGSRYADPKLPRRLRAHAHTRYHAAPRARANARRWLRRNGYGPA